MDALAGLYHWLTQASPPPFRDPARGVVALLDPDQMLLRPITAALGAYLREGDARAALYDASDTPRVLMDGKGELRALPPRVAPGFPAGQQSAAVRTLAAPTPRRASRKAT